jgi:hypothetical protein
MNFNDSFNTRRAPTLPSARTYYISGLGLFLSSETDKRRASVSIRLSVFKSVEKSVETAPPGCALR